MSGKKFRFSLKGVLKLRRHETQQAEQALAAAMKTRRAQQERVQTARQRLAEAKHPIGVSSGPADLRVMRQRDAFRHEARQALQAELTKLGKCQQEEAERRAALQKRRRAEESLETLREQEQKQHDKERRDAEASFLDEQAIMRHHQQSPLSFT